MQEQFFTKQNKERYARIVGQQWQHEVEPRQEKKARDVKHTLFLHWAAASEHV